MERLGDSPRELAGGETERSRDWDIFSRWTNHYASHLTT